MGDVVGTRGKTVQRNLDGALMPLGYSLNERGQGFCDGKLFSFSALPNEYRPASSLKNMSRMTCP